MKSDQKPRLRIAMIASNVIRIPPTPPEKYVPPGWSGAPELIVHYITEELVQRGHAVTLFASGDSVTAAKLVAVTAASTGLTIGAGPHKEYEDLLISRAYQLARQGSFDIMHSHFSTRTAHIAPLVSTPTLATLHSPLEGLDKEILSHYQQTQFYASISNNQRQGLPALNYAVTAYNGIDIQTIPYVSRKEKYLVFSGRILPIKGVAEAIEVAKKTDHQLLIFGSVDPASEYWVNQIKPQVDDDQIKYMGMIPRQELFTYLGKAKAFIFPLRWEEPFGLVTVEAMAAGTPTIAFKRGSLPEIIADGVTGFLVDDLPQMVEAVSRLEQIDPAACRLRVEQEFTVARMVDRYEEAYYRILNQRKA